MPGRLESQQPQRLARGALLARSACPRRARGGSRAATPSARGSAREGVRARLRFAITLGVPDENPLPVSQCPARGGFALASGSPRSGRRRHSPLLSAKMIAVYIDAASPNVSAIIRLCVLARDSSDLIQTSAPRSPLRPRARGRHSRDAHLCHWAETRDRPRSFVRSLPSARESSSSSASCELIPEV